jgi:hypothetical protein
MESLQNFEPCNDDCPVTKKANGAEVVEVRESIAYNPLLGANVVTPSRLDIILDNGDHLHVDGARPVLLNESSGPTRDLLLRQKCCKLGGRVMSCIKG